MDEITLKKVFEALRNDARVFDARGQEVCCGPGCQLIWAHDRTIIPMTPYLFENWRIQPQKESTSVSTISYDDQKIFIARWGEKTLFHALLEKRGKYILLRFIKWPEKLRGVGEIVTGVVSFENPGMDCVTIYCPGEERCFDNKVVVERYENTREVYNLLSNRLSNLVTYIEQNFKEGR